jgi:uncharacterized tellurite resistance protein B-like protein
MASPITVVKSIEAMSEIVDFFARYVEALGSDEEALPTAPTAHDLQVATTVLLVQILRADHGVSEDEVNALILALENVLGLDHVEARDLMRIAAARVLSGSALARATVLLDQHLTKQQRLQLVEWLWRIAFADAEILAHEEYLVRKVAGLLSLSTADLIEAKVRAKESL